VVGIALCGGEANAGAFKLIGARTMRLIGCQFHRNEDLAISHRKVTTLAETPRSSLKMPAMMSEISSNESSPQRRDPNSRQALPTRPTNTRPRLTEVPRCLRKPVNQPPC